MPEPISQAGDKIFYIFIDIDETFSNSVGGGVDDINGSNEYKSAEAWIQFIREMKEVCHQSGRTLRVGIITAKSTFDRAVSTIMNHLREFAPALDPNGKAEFIPENQYLYRIHTGDLRMNMLIKVKKGLIAVDPLPDDQILPPIHMVYKNIPLENRRISFSKSKAMSEISEFFNPPIPKNQMLIIDNSTSTLIEAREAGFLTVSAELMDFIKAAELKEIRTIVCKAFLDQARALIRDCMREFKTENSEKIPLAQSLPLQLPLSSLFLSKEKKTELPLRSKFFIIFINIESIINFDPVHSYPKTFNGVDDGRSPKAWIELIEDAKALCQENGLTLIIQIFSLNSEGIPDKAVFLLMNSLREYLPVIDKEGKATPVPGKELWYKQHVLETRKNIYQLSPKEAALDLESEDLMPIHMVDKNFVGNEEVRAKNSRFLLMQDVSKFFPSPVPFGNMLLIDRNPNELSEANQKGFLTISTTLFTYIGALALNPVRTVVCKHILQEARAVIKARMDQLKMQNAALNLSNRPIEPVVSEAMDCLPAVIPDTKATISAVTVSEDPGVPAAPEVPVEASLEIIISEPPPAYSERSPKVLNKNHAAFFDMNLPSTNSSQPSACHKEDFTPNPHCP